MKRPLMLWCTATLTLVTVFCLVSACRRKAATIDPGDSGYVVVTHNMKAGVTACPAGPCGAIGKTTNTQFDPNNCGACGTVCGIWACTGAGCGTQPTACVEGQCINGELGNAVAGCCASQIHGGGGILCPTTSGGSTYPTAPCTDILTDVNNCGACGNVCIVGAPCINGWCPPASEGHTTDGGAHGNDGGEHGSDGGGHSGEPGDA
jgi:hypothetical protein